MFLYLLVFGEHSHQISLDCSHADAAPCRGSATGFQECHLWTQVLQRLGFQQSTVSKTLRAQTRILLFNYWATYCILKAKKPNFQPMEPVAA